MKIGFLGLLTLIFITLKLCEVISWSWLWVLAPMWLGFALFVTMFLGTMLFLLGYDYLSTRKKKESKGDNN